ncbi:MAG TPA: hypothetical protein V6D47_19240 [Oscillatoriaceae cyanobacterium]
MTPRLAARRGFTLLEVAFAAVLLIVGTLFMGLYFGNVYSQLNPHDAWGGLRTYMLSNEMLKAQAEGLRVLHDIPLQDSQCKLITEPPGLGFSLSISRSMTQTSTEQLYYYDLTMQNQGHTIGQLSLSTLRSVGIMEGQDGKIGL